jgi:hypothetical protein
VSTYWLTEEALAVLHGLARCVLCGARGWIEADDPLYPGASIDVRCPACCDSSVEETVSAGLFCWRDFGWWRCADGNRRLLTWNEGSKTLALCALHRWEKDEVLGTFADEDEVAGRLKDWELHNSDPDGRAWLDATLAGAE